MDIDLSYCVRFYLPTKDKQIQIYIVNDIDRQIVNLRQIVYGLWILDRYFRYLYLYGDRSLFTTRQIENVYTYYLVDDRQITDLIQKDIRQ